MAQTESPAYPESEIEGLLSALTGVLAARVTVNTFGRIEEVHVLADARFHPKQIVRNVESALSAAFDLGVDRRLISVAQVRPEESEVLDELSHEVEANAEQDSARARYVFIGFDARTQPDLETACRVTIRRDREAFSGSGSGPSTLVGRAQAAARAVFAAIAAARTDQDLELEGATIVESNGRSYVLISATGRLGRHGHLLTGAAPLHRSPEEAAILAALQATNRWAEIDG